MGNVLMKKKRTKDIIENIIFVVLFVTLMILLATVILGISPFFYVEGTSMHSTLEDGDLIVIDRTSFDNLKIGDIVVFNKPSPYSYRVVHRIFEIKNINGEKVLITKGDNSMTNPNPDSWQIPKENYIGKYIGIRIPYAGFLGKAIAPPINYIIIVSLLIYVIYIDVYEPRKKNAQKTITT
jgi:signal peptidase